MKRTRVGWALAAALLISVNGAFAAANPKVNANGTATEESTETEAGGDEAAELAKQLQNPVASLISVPFQNNFDFNLGRAFCGHAVSHRKGKTGTHGRDIR